MIKRRTPRPVCPECGKPVSRRMHVYSDKGLFHAGCVLQQHLREYYTNHKDRAPAKQT